MPLCGMDTLHCLAHHFLTLNALERPMDKLLEVGLASVAFVTSRHSLNELGLGANNMNLHFCSGDGSVEP